MNSREKMKKNNEQEMRIRQMECHLNTALAAVKHLEGALDEWEAAQDAIIALNEYYGSQAWHQDLADDEAGFCPRTSNAVSSARTPSGTSSPTSATSTPA